MSSESIPKTIEESVKKLLELSNPEDLSYFKSLTKDKAGAIAHHTVGRWMRNNWGLWKQDSELYEYLTKMGFLHADDMSGIIIDCLWSELNGKPWTIEEEIQKYRKHWEQYNDKG